MQEFRINVAMDVRAYGSLRVQADNIEAAAERVTPEMVADKFEPHGSSEDIDWHNPTDIWLSEAIDDGSGEEREVHREIPGTMVGTIWIVITEGDSGTEIQYCETKEGANALAREWCAIEWDSDEPMPDDWQEAYESIDANPFRTEWITIEEIDLAKSLEAQIASAVEAGQ